MQPEAFFDDYGAMLIFGAGLFLVIFGLVMTVLERKLIVSRKQVTGVAGINSVICGGIIGCMGLAQWNAMIYGEETSLLPAFLFLAAAIAVYAVLCAVVKKADYPPEERYTKE